MKKLATYLFVFTLILTFALPQKAHAQIPAKAKAFLTIVGYGTAGGALLGAASMAFGTSPRAIAQGASIGLYAGIAFGAYVLFAVSNKKPGSYDDNSTYSDSTDVYGEDYDAQNGGDEGREPQGQFLNRFTILQEKFQNGQSFTMDSQKQKGGGLPPLSVNIINFSF